LNDSELTGTSIVSETNLDTVEERTERGRPLELVLQQLWEKARRVSAIVVKLRDENSSLRERVKELEDASRSLYTERENLVVRLAQQESEGNTSRDEARDLRQRVRQLEESDTQARRMLDETSLHTEQMKRELARLQANGSGSFTKEEKEALKVRVMELIGKINSRL